MFKRLPLWFVVVLVPLDFIAASFAGAAAWFSRFHPIAQSLKPVIFKISFAEYFSLVLLVAAFNTMVVASLGLYNIRQEVKLFGTVTKLILATSVTFAAITSAIFIRQELFDSRFLVIVGWFFATIFLLLERSAINFFIDKLGSKIGVPSIKILLIGQDYVSERLVKILDEDKSLGMRVVKQLAVPDKNEIATFIADNPIDEILLADTNYPKEKILELIEFSNDKRLLFSFVPNLFQTLTVNSKTAVIGDVPFVELRRTSLEGWGKIAKRTMDTIGSFVGIIFFAPLMLSIALAIKLDSPGTVLYKSKRVGPRGQFTMFKFRTMKMEYCTGEGYPNAEQAEKVENELIQKHSTRSGPVPKVLNDPRRTKLGKFLENSSLDELPQFFNSLKGDISLVGPRPHVPKEVEKYEKSYHRVFALKPGITGMSQISGRSDLNFEDEFRLDLHYIENWSLWLDLIIVFKTPIAILFKRHRS